MAFNLCQSLILFGLFQGIICIVVLMSLSSIKSKSNLYLSLLIVSFIGSIGQYWLKDVGLIDNNTMQLVFLPWQMLVAPLFYLYVHSLKIFDQFPFRKWILFAPVAAVLAVHFIVKTSILSQGISDWIRPEWVSSFYLIEELTSLAYCLIVSVIVYRLIKKEKKRPNYDGFGLNSGIVTWINVMLKMGLVLALIWIISLYVVNQNQNFRQYYFLWIIMVIVLNVLGIAGIYYTWKGGGFSVVDISSLTVNKKEQEDTLPKMTVSTPQKYMSRDFLDSLFLLSSQLSSANTVPKLQEIVKTWFNEELKISDIDFSSENGVNQGALDNNNYVQIPYNTDPYKLMFIDIRLDDKKAFDQSHLYNFNVIGKALSFHENRILSKEKEVKLDLNNQVYQSLIKSFEEEGLYTNPSLDLNSLANELGVSSGYLSKVINHIAKKSFNDFVNDYRVEKVKSLMINQDYAHYNIVGYGLEAGFNSKSTFYKAFQNKEGVSPGKYLENISHSASE